jgi:hypothetical protein
MCPTQRSANGCCARAKNDVSNLKAGYAGAVSLSIWRCSKFLRLMCALVFATDFFSRKHVDLEKTLHWLWRMLQPRRHPFRRGWIHIQLSRSSKCIAQHVRLIFLPGRKCMQFSYSCMRGADDSQARACGWSAGRACACACCVSPSDVSSVRSTCIAQEKAQELVLVERKSDGRH